MKKRKTKKTPPDELITTGLFVVLLFLLTMQIFLRYVVNKSVSWSEEASRWFFIWVIYFGCMLAAKDEKHIRITLQLTKLPEKIQKIIITIGDSLWVVFSFVMSVLGFKMVLEMFRYPIRSNTIGVNIVLVYTIIPISYFFMAFWVIRNAFKRFGKGAGFELKDSRLGTD